MKELDKTKVYYLGDLTEYQREELANITKNPYVAKNIKQSSYLIYSKDINHWQITEFTNNDTTNAKELFEEKTLCQAYKEKTNKLNYELDFNFITQLAERMQANKGKYEPYNWQKLDNIEDLKQALFRHVTEVMKGNYKDDNRLFGHLEAIALNSMFINYQLNKK